MGLSAPHWEASSAGEGNEAKRCDFFLLYPIRLENRKKGKRNNIARCQIHPERGLRIRFVYVEFASLFQDQKTRNQRSKLAIHFLLLIRTKRSR